MPFAYRPKWGDFRETRSNGKAPGKQSRTPDLKERVCKQT